MFKLIVLACMSFALSEPDKNGIRETFVKNQADIQACAKENPEVLGKLALECDIDENGKASNIKAHETASVIQDEKMINCFRSKMTNWEFPKSAKGETVHISYPLHFNKKK